MQTYTPVLDTNPMHDSRPDVTCYHNEAYFLKDDYHDQLTRTEKISPQKKQHT